MRDKPHSHVRIQRLLPLTVILLRAWPIFHRLSKLITTHSYISVGDGTISKRREHTQSTFAMAESLFEDNERTRAEIISAAGHLVGSKFN